MANKVEAIPETKLRFTKFKFESLLTRKI